MLPQLDGYEVCRRLRQRSSVPIIMLTAKAEEIDKVLGLELGADDYITKPFSHARVPQPREGGAAARRDAAPRGGRRRRGAARGPRACASTSPSAACASAARRSRLTYVEFEILARSPASPGACSPATMLLARVWGDSAYRDPRTIDVHIRHLREKLERDAKDPEYIFTVRGVGYRFRDPTTTRRSAAPAWASSATASRSGWRSSSRHHARRAGGDLLLRRPAAGVEPAPGEAAQPADRGTRLLAPGSIRAIESQVTAKRRSSPRCARRRQRQRARHAARRSGTRGGTPLPYVRSDSTTQRQIDRPLLPGGRRRGPQRATRPPGGSPPTSGRVGEAARPLRFNKQASGHVDRLLGAADRRARPTSR